MQITNRPSSRFLFACRSPADLASPGSSPPRNWNTSSVALFAGIEPPDAGWRASVRKPVTLPQYPMVLYRGGYPDGS
jgi:hypothetical protein